MPSLQASFITLQERTVLESPEGLVGTDDNLLAILKTGEHFNISCTGDAGGYRDELGTLLAVCILFDHIDALNRSDLRSSRSRCGFSTFPLVEGGGVCTWLELGSEARARSVSLQW